MFLGSSHAVENLSNTKRNTSEDLKIYNLHIHNISSSGLTLSPVHAQPEITSEFESMSIDTDCLGPMFSFSMCLCRSGSLEH